MVPVTTRIAALVLLVLWMTTTVAFGATGGCGELADPGDRASCEARAVARAEARAEVERRLDGRDDASHGDAAAAARSADWQAAVDEAGGFDASAIVEPRLIAAVGGLAWFFLVLRHRRRRARTA